MKREVYVADKLFILSCINLTIICQRYTYLSTYRSVSMTGLLKITIFIFFHIFRFLGISRAQTGIIITNIVINTAAVKISHKISAIIQTYIQCQIR